MSTWVERVKSRMKELDLTQEELAEKLGITRGAITHYIAGRRVPPLKQFEKLSSVLKSDPAWLQFGISRDTISSTKLVKEIRQTSPYYPIPVLTWEQASQQKEVSKIKSLHAHECITHFYTDQPRWYALRVKGESMTSLSAGTSFLEGDMIIVDPDAKAKHGDFVVAIIGNAKEATLKQYVIDAGIKYLKPLNIQYPITKIEKGMVIIAVVRKVIKL